MDGEELDHLKSELRSLRDAIQAHDERRSLTATAGAADDGGETAEPDDRPDPHTRLDELTAKLTDLESRPAPEPIDQGGRLDELATKLAELDARVTSVSTELANQVSELGNDIDALGNRPPGEPPGEAVLGELRDGQVRLANEQARYQIAFREDLARLAEQLRRPGSA